MWRAKAGGRSHSWRKHSSPGTGGTSVGGGILSHDQLTVEGTAGLHLGGMEEHARQAVMCQAGGETFLEVGKVAPVGMGASWCQA